jgi:hypothetical protein
LYGEKTPLGYPILGQTTKEAGELNVRLGRWKAVHFEGGELAGFQPIKKPVSDGSLVGNPNSPTSITRSEIEINAYSRIFCDAKSRTEGLNEFERDARFEQARRIDQIEDRVERVHTKIAQWPHPASRIDDGRGKVKFGDRAVRVYPKVVTT